MSKWILPTLSEVISRSELATASCTNSVEVATTQPRVASNGIQPTNSTPQSAHQRLKAEREWQAGIAATEQLLRQSLNSQSSKAAKQGLVFAGPAPVLSDLSLLAHLQTWVFTAESLTAARMSFQLPPAALTDDGAANSGSTLALLPEDPLRAERFCLVLTAEFSLVLVLGENADGELKFQFSFAPEVVEQAWRSLQARVKLTHPHTSTSQLDTLVAKYPPVEPNYRTVMQFSRWLLDYLPELSAQVAERQPEAKADPLLTNVGDVAQAQSATRLDVELLQAFAHEVRTPLTTIRTLTRLLLKRRDLTADVVKRLKTIEHECTGQIDRMELIFRAVELQTSKPKPHSAQLTVMSLDQVLQQSIPRWQQSASRRDLTLDVVLPQQLPTVISDPQMLDQVLTGLIENFTRSLPAGSHIQVQVIHAGNQLKLQLLPQSLSESDRPETEYFSVTPIRQSLGQLLMFQPETGNISLNLAATKHLFQAIGGKLIVRQRPHQGEVLTIFLPLELGNTSFSCSSASQ